MARNIDDWITGYMEYTQHQESPNVFHLWAAVGTIAGALRGKVHIDMGYFKWQPNFFIIFVAPPGVVSKSTTMGVGLSLLRSVKGIKFGPDSTTWQAITDAFQDAAENFHVDGRKVRMSPITVAASELGTFLDPRNREMLDVLNDLWDGRDIPWKRRTRGDGETEIQNPWFHFMGCTTPGWIEENWPEYAIKGGFASRTIFVYADKKREYIAYPHVRMNDDNQKLDLLKGKLITDLQSIAKLSGSYTLSDDAIAWGTEWYEQHWKVDAPKMDQDTFGGYLSRKQTHIHKLAMVLQASRSDEMVIDTDILERASVLITTLEDNFHYIFESMSDNKYAKQALAIIKVVHSFPKPVTRQTVWRPLMKYMTIDEFNTGLKGAIDSGYIRQTGDGANLRLTAVRQDTAQTSG